MSGQLILLVGDDIQARASAARWLARADRSVEESAHADAEQALGRPWDAVVLLADDGAREAVAFLHLAHERSADLPVVVVSRTQAGELTRQGAFAVVASDLDPVALSALVDRAARHQDLGREVARLRREARGARDRVPLLGRSERMREMSRQVDELSGRGAPVLLIGATGTGKNLVARELHARSPRSQGPFVSVSCAGLNETLLESRLFGHRRGAFPGATHDHDGALRAASGGTLYVDRLETMPVPIQARLASFLQSGEVLAMGAAQAIASDVRLVLGSVRDLTPLTRAGTFRDDLFRKLSPSMLSLPTLAERPEDIPFLAEAFAAEAAEHCGVAPRRFDAEAQAILLAHPWPSNVRELRESVEWAFSRSLGDVIRAEHLPPLVRAGARSGLARDPERLPTLAEAEAELVALVLEECGGNKTEAARRLGIDRKRLYRKIRKYKLLGGEEGDDEGDDVDD